MYLAVSMYCCCGAETWNLLHFHKILLYANENCVVFVLLLYVLWFFPQFMTTAAHLSSQFLHSWLRRKNWVFLLWTAHGNTIQLMIVETRTFLQQNGRLCYKKRKKYSNGYDDAVHWYILQNMTCVDCWNQVER